MSDQLALCVDHVTTPVNIKLLPKSEAPSSSVEISSLQIVDQQTCAIDIEETDNTALYEGKEPLIQNVECRICQEEDSVKNLETPCACSGSLKFAHRKCVQRWCNEKGDTTCEICNQPYQPGYTAPLPPSQSEDATIDFSEGWTVAGTPLDLNDARLLAMVAAERQIMEAEYDENANGSASGAAFFRSVALVLIALLLMRHALSIGDGNREDDASAFFSVFLFRVVGFLLPCYLMAWAISMLQRRRQRQGAAELAGHEFALMLQAGEDRGVQVTIAPGSAATSRQESPY